MSDLDAMKAENVAVWRRDRYLPDYERQVVESTSRYLPALEDEVDRLRGENAELRQRIAATLARIMSGERYDDIDEAAKAEANKASYRVDL